jgi:protein TonB
MFDDFRPSASSQVARKRMGGSMLAAAVLYGSIGALIIGGTTAATTTVVESMTQVEFAPPPPPPPPMPEPQQAEPVANARPKLKRHELKPPDVVPTEKPKESNEALSASEGTGPVDGFLNGVEGGTGTAAAKPSAAIAPPAPLKPQPLIAAIAAKGNSAPAYSASAKRKEIEGVVVVSFDVLENGSVANLQIVSGPEELREGVMKTVLSWRFTPASRGGKPVRTRLTKAIRFQLSDA